MVRLDVQTLETLTVSGMVTVMTSSVKASVVVSEKEAVIVKLISAGTAAVFVCVIIAADGVIVFVTCITLVEVLRLVFVTGLGEYPGQKPLQKP